MTKTVPGTRMECPDNCRYRNKLAPFCGYCMMEILAKQRKEDKDGDRQKEGCGPVQDQ